MDYMFTAKEDSHRYLYQETASLEKLGEVHSLERRHRRGPQHQRWRYRWANGIRLRNTDDSLNVNWPELRIFEEDGKQRFRFACIGSHLVSEHNVEELVQAARTRWKIENENINTLKTKGYHIEHNFGHGKQFLAQTLLSLNLLTFLFHTLLELLDRRCTLIRGTRPRRDTFFQHLAVLTQYMCFQGWQQIAVHAGRAEARRTRADRTPHPLLPGLLQRSLPKTIESSRYVHDPAVILCRNSTTLPEPRAPS
jgi:hypothetical protein